MLFKSTISRKINKFPPLKKYVNLYTLNQCDLATFFRKWFSYYSSQLLVCNNQFILRGMTPLGNNDH